MRFADLSRPAGPIQTHRYASAVIAISDALTRAIKSRDRKESESPLDLHRHRYSNTILAKHDLV